MASNLTRGLVRAFRRRTSRPGFQPVRRLFYQRIYSSKHFANVDTYNYGYAPVDECVKEWRFSYGQTFQIQMYLELMKSADIRLGSLKADAILEVSCGRGGGLAFVDHAFAPRHTVGLDTSPAAVRVARKRFGLDYMLGDAVNLPFEDHSFDYVINVEASYGYHPVLFLAQVRRVLRPDGLFLLADSRFGRAERVLAGVNQELAGAGFSIISLRDITANVYRSCVEDNARREALTRRAPIFARGFIREMVATEGTERFIQFRDRQRCYYICAARPA